MAPKSVAIIGCGPAGLVSAKTLLRSHASDTFRVTVFEKAERIGGIWSVTPDHPEGGIVPPHMPTNLSQFAVSFSDLAWNSLDLSGPPSASGSRIAMHPQAWQVNAYLEEYRRRYVPDSVLRLGIEVRGIEEGEKGGWTVKYAKTGSADEVHKQFDLCILASGFYAKALPIKCELDGFCESISPIKIVHSSRYRGLDEILPYGSNVGKKLLVVGGANSGGEVAAALAFDLSNARYSPEGADLDYEIIHVLPKPIYGLPLFVPSADSHGSFVPLDIRFYDLSKRPDQPLSLKFGRHNDDSKKMLHGLIQGMLGTDPYENGLQKPLHEQEGELHVPKAALQDNWASYVRSGDIKIHLGRVTTLHSHGPNKPVSASIQSVDNLDETTTLEDIAGIIYATGYTPEPALQILPDRVKQALSYDPSYPRLPVILPEDSLASHPAVPNLGFVGLYEGPYWGVIEMQARQLAARWASEAKNTDTAPELSERTKARLDSFKDIRSALKDAPHLVPQYIFSDYLAIMEEAARDLKLIRNDGPWSVDQGPITPARYLDSGSNKVQADRTVSSLQEIIQASSAKGRFIPHVVFRGLQGHWKMHRDLKSARPEYPTGVFIGEAQLHPRRPTAITKGARPEEKNVGFFDQEYLYVETGTLKTDSGLTFPTYKNYAWRFCEDPEQISVWFVKQDGRRVDYRYHDLHFVVDQSSPAEASEKVVWRANSDHLCEKDMYVTKYSFVFDGVALQEFEVVHEVKGPNKDYVSRTKYTR